MTSATEVGWFPLRGLPALAKRYRRRIGHAPEDRPDTVLDLRPET